MDIRQLKYFMAIAEERQITAAARRLHMAQPPLSQQLKKMEDELSVPLFNRKGNFMELTQAGTALYKRAMDIVSLLEETLEEAKEISEGTKGHIKIGVNTIAAGYLTAILAQYLQMYPLVYFTIYEGNSVQLTNKIKAGELDIAFVIFPIESHDVNTLSLHSERFVFLANEDMGPFDEQVSLHTISKYPIILPSNEGLGIYKMIISEFSRLGEHPVIIGESSDSKLLIELIKKGLGVTIVPESITKLYKLDGLRWFEILDTKLESTVGAIWSRQRYHLKATQNLIELIKGDSN